ncbi:MAG: hypothetical protein U1F24_08145 [Alphaproteobacteria bacterium]
MTPIMSSTSAWKGYDAAIESVGGGRAGGRRHQGRRFRRLGRAAGSSGSASSNAGLIAAVAPLWDEICAQLAGGARIAKSASAACERPIATIPSSWPGLTWPSSATADANRPRLFLVELGADHLADRLQRLARVGAFGFHQNGRSRCAAPSVSRLMIEVPFTVSSPRVTRIALERGGELGRTWPRRGRAGRAD